MFIQFMMVCGILSLVHVYRVLRLLCKKMNLTSHTNLLRQFPARFKDMRIGVSGEGRRVPKLVWLVKMGIKDILNPNNYDYDISLLEIEILR